jgi:cytochrome c-type biogenesis protein CcmH/NrfF
MIVAVAVLLAYLRRRNRVVVDEDQLSEDEASRAEALLQEGQK